jgi:hypothetical protein
MTNYSQRIAFVSAESTTSDAETWVHLEQTKPSKLAAAATMRDIYRMWMAAATGQSARAMRAEGCPIEFQGDLIHIYLGFYAWPNPTDLDFTLQASTGIIEQRKNIRKQREFSVFVNNAEKLSLPYYMENITIVWESPCYNRFGEQIGTPRVTITPTEIRFEPEVFAGLRIYGTAIGVSAVSHITVSKPIEVDEDIEIDPSITGASITYEHGVYTPSVPKPANLNSAKIAAPSCTITAAWQGLTERETDQLNLEVPQCVIDALNMCPGMWDKFAEFCFTQKKMTVYYDACTGEIKHTKIGYDGRSFCTKIELKERPWWYPEDFWNEPGT